MWPKIKINKILKEKEKQPAVELPSIFLMTKWQLWQALPSVIHSLSLLAAMPDAAGPWHMAAPGNPGFLTTCWLDPGVPGKRCRWHSVSPSNLTLEIMHHLSHHILFAGAATRAQSVPGDRKEETPSTDGRVAGVCKSLRIGNCCSHFGKYSLSELPGSNGDFHKVLVVSTAKS